VTTDPARLRYLADAVATATPAQRIVMLYDRLGIDIERAAVACTATAENEAAQNEPAIGEHASHVRHAQRIIAELMASLDGTFWSGADELSSLYGYLLRELICAHAEPDAVRLRAAGRIVADLRSSWFEAGQQLADDRATDRLSSSPVPAASGAWVS
jgi:flagellar protein FliS